MFIASSVSSARNAGTFTCRGHANAYRMGTGSAVANNATAGQITSKEVANMTTNIIPVTGNAILTRKAQVEKLFPVVHWGSASTGYIECPGCTSHSTVGGERDCAVFIDRVPTIACFHQSCADDVEAANKKLRKAIREAEADGTEDVKKAMLSAEQKAWITEKQRQHALRLRAASLLPVVIKQNAWTPEQAPLRACVGSG